MKTYLHILILIATVSVALLSCNRSVRTGEEKTSIDKPEVVATTTMIADVVKQIGGEHIEVHGLMGPGIDPHLYKATESDVSRLFSADMIFYNGLHLEGKMGEVFEKMEQQGKQSFAIAEALPETELIPVEDSEEQYDPHVWFDISNWKKVARYVADALSINDPPNKESYMKNLKEYLSQLDSLGDFVQQRIGEVPVENRLLVTAHDAFEYFGKAYNFEVIGLQGISTSSEAGAADVRELAGLIAERKIPAIFIETSVPHRNIEALKEAVRSRGFEVKTGGVLYSDALGSPDSEAGDYIGMYKHNVVTITDALK
ncbi:MAG: metal ABC transporter solute-binding protein, Zn/Mn family [Bacteroidota bacterium]